MRASEEQATATKVLPEGGIRPTQRPAFRKILFGTERCFAWSIILSCVVGVAASSGPIVLTGAGVLMAALNEEFGWNRAEVSFSATIYTMVTALIMPYVGHMYDRVGVRTIVLPAIAVSALALSL